MLRDIIRGESTDILAAQRVIGHVNPDVILLMGIDYDHGGETVRAFSNSLAAYGAEYSHTFTNLPNSGLQTGIDMNGDGRAGTARDAQGYGRYAGADGMAVLSRYPIGSVRDFSEMLWAEFPNADMPMTQGAPFPSKEVQDIQRLSTTAHWDIQIKTPDGPLHLLAYSATPPVFDGPEDMNGKRNADETRFWIRYIDGDLAQEPPAAPFVILGNANLDPHDGEGNREVIQELLAHPRIQDPMPASEGGLEAVNTLHLGDAGLHTASWGENLPSNLRVDYVLPSVQLHVTDSGVFWPPTSSELAGLLRGATTHHRLVWIDMKMP
ncbi:endonuclease/exonuclease/phosphatase family protein [Falsihalocynthiibacter sp. SS001]|uniref:endonuclease/exonuclease/phosphatase family protein n=1 Tax=Falsihalocynthiibacter sp. SS001 TaxID=3349698 RepID=UPI0036D280CF